MNAAAGPVSCKGMSRRFWMRALGCSRSWRCSRRPRTRSPLAALRRVLQAALYIDP
ncbi:MAG TPA: hypothetical protein VFA20_28780 [Myxococcaceae bacterium]|nr:hypothetical protein [Myxococcaceae bacterium]